MSPNLKTTTCKGQTSPLPISLRCDPVIWFKVAVRGAKKYHGIFVATCSPQKIKAFIIEEKREN